MCWTKTVLNTEAYIWILYAPQIVYRWTVRAICVINCMCSVDYSVIVINVSTL